MPSPSPANSSEPAFILIAAPSGRALAQAARASGYVPLVVDFFDDLDTQGLAADTRLAEGDFTHGFEAASLMTALTDLSENRQAIGLVYGAGFEDRVELLEALAQRWTLFGNTPDVVARVKDPRALARLCADLGINHPAIRFEAPSDGADWLVKHAGGSGGMHVASVTSNALNEGDYYQRRVAGRPVSALLLADGTRSMVLGFSEQWAAPAPGQPWRFGGSARPASLDGALAAKLEDICHTIAAAARLVGLNSIDFLVDAADYHLLEINPRPGATLDIFHDLDGRLLRAHVEACQGHLPAEALRFEPAEAAAFIYAPCLIESVPAYEWPSWTADRQKPLSRVEDSDPLCTVIASGPDLASARRLLDARAVQVLTFFSETHSKKETAA